MVFKNGLGVRAAYLLVGAEWPGCDLSAPISQWARQLWQRGKINHCLRCVGRRPFEAAFFGQLMRVWKGVMADVAMHERLVARARRRLDDVIADRADPPTIHLHRRRLLLAERRLEAARSAAPPASGRVGSRETR